MWVGSTTTDTDPNSGDLDNDDVHSSLNSETQQEQHEQPRTPRTPRTPVPSGERVQVVVRLRPPLANEKVDAQLFSNFHVKTNTINMKVLNNGPQGKTFTMDHLFNPDAKQEEHNKTRLT